MLAVQCPLAATDHWIAGLKSRDTRNTLYGSHMTNRANLVAVLERRRIVKHPRSLAPTQQLVTLCKTSRTGDSIMSVYCGGGEERREERELVSDPHIPNMTHLVRVLHLLVCSRYHCSAL